MEHFLANEQLVLVLGFTSVQRVFLFLGEICFNTAVTILDRFPTGEHCLVMNISQFGTSAAYFWIDLSKLIWCQ